jgi:hypothetical protein
MYAVVIQGDSRGHVGAAPDERVASQDPPRRQGRSHRRAACPDRRLGVRRTGRLEPALASEHARERRPVQTDQPDEHRPRRPPGGPQRRSKDAECASASSGVSPHGRGFRIGRGRHRRGARVAHCGIPRVRSRPRISASSSLVRAPGMVPRAMTTTWTSAGIRGARPRHASRRIRRALFRTTAPPILRPATKAGRAPGCPGATYSITRGPKARRPRERAARISRFRRTRPRGRRARGAGELASRALRPTAGSGPWPGGGPGWRVRPASASGPGTRDASCGGGCSAGRSSSLLTCEVSRDATY